MASRIMIDKFMGDSIFTKSMILIKRYQQRELKGIESQKTHP